MIPGFRILLAETLWLASDWLDSARALLLELAGVIVGDEA